MSETSHEILKFASMLAAGVITEEVLSDQLGDDNLLAEVTVLAAGIGAGTVAAVAYETAYETPIIGDTMRVAEDVLDVGLDIIGDVFDIF